MEEVVISLTSYAKRLHTVAPAVESLLRQTHSAKKIVLWLDKEAYPKGRGDLPSSLRKLLSQHEQFEVAFTKDIGPFTKLIPALKAYPDSVIITADDDVVYHPEMVQRLIETHLQKPSSIVAHCVSDLYMAKNGALVRTMGAYGFGKIRENDFPLRMMLGVGGVLYPPRALSPKVFEEETFKRVTPTNDDIWFWYSATLNHTPVVLCSKQLPDLAFVQNDATTLSEINESRGDAKNQEYLRKILNSDKDFAKRLNLYISAHRYKLLLLRLRRLFFYFPLRIYYCIRTGGISFLLSEAKKRIR